METLRSRFRRRLVRFVRALGVVALALAGAAAAADPYRVEGIAVDVSAANAVAAREQAIQQAQREGLRRLLQRLTAPEDAGRLPAVGPLRLPEYVRSFEIADERVAPTRYLATLNVAYQAPAVQRLLDERGIAYVAEPSRPILVVPAVRDGGRLVLWQEEGPWRQAWGSAVSAAPFLQLVLPLGDLDDISALSPEQAAARDAAAFGRLAQRYDAENAVLAVAQPTQAPDADTPAAIAVELEPVSGDELPSGRITLTSRPPAAGKDIWSETAAAAARRLEETWKSRRLLTGGATSTLSLVVPITDLAGWVHIRRQLDSLPEVRQVRIDSFARDRAELTLIYAGDVARLQDALGRRGLVLSSENEKWQLQRAVGRSGARGL